MPGETDQLQQQQQHDPEQAPPEPAPAAPPAYQSILDRMDILEPGDHALLAKILQQHPELRDQIIARAQEVCGNDCVAKALQILQGGEQEHAPLETQEEAPKPADAPKESSQLESLLFNLQVLEQSDVQLLAKIIADHPAWYAEIVAEATKLLGEGVVSQALALLQEKAEQDPQGTSADEAGEEDEEEVEESSKRRRPPKGGWVKRAAKYNDRHPSGVRRFNQLTRNACVGEDGVVDPNLVWSWQSKHGLTPDGMVGPDTVAAARNARHGAEQESQPQDTEPAEQPPNG